MAIQKNITIDGIDVPFKASAAVPRLYRLKFRRDIYQDFAALQKSVGENTEESSTPLFLLRCVQLGLSMGDLNFLTIGLVNDMFTERENDECHYDVLADQRDFDAF